MKRGTAAVLVMACIAIVIGTSLISVVTSTANSTALGLSGPQKTLVDLLPLLFILMIVVAAAMAVVAQVE